MGQTGTWDVDGTGMQAIEDRTVAEKIRAKVNAMNLSLTVASPLLVLAYAALPTLGGGK